MRAAAEREARVERRADERLLGARRWRIRLAAAERVVADVDPHGVRRRPRSSASAARQRARHPVVAHGGHQRGAGRRRAGPSNSSNTRRMNCGSPVESM